MKSEKLVYRKFIKDSESETRKVFEGENIEDRENIKNIETQLRMSLNILNIFALLVGFHLLVV